MNKHFAQALCGIAMLALAPGCSRDRTLDVTLVSRLSVAAPQPPPILTTPAAVMLTNNAGFSAKVKVEGMTYSGSGTISGRAGKLLFVPDSEKKDKHTPAGRYSFIWDIAKNQGFVLSDALQGWAPMTLSGTGTATNISLASSAGREDSQSGLTKLTADMSDGRRLDFTAATGTGGVPSQLQGGEPLFAATFSRMSTKAPEASMFEIPEGFTAYNSPESMVDELAARFRNLKHKSY